MDDLAAELGMSKKTLYGCFKSKIELLRAVMLQKIKESEMRFEQLGREGNVTQEMEALLAAFGASTEEIRPRFVRDLQRDAPELFQLVEQHRQTLIRRHFKHLFDRGRRTGAIRRDIPVELMIEILLGTTEAIVNPRKVLELNLTPRAAYSAVLRVVLQGIMVRDVKGNK